MSSAARLYRLNVALAGLGAAGVAVAAGVSAKAVSLAPAAGGSVADVCRRLLGLHVAIGSALTAFLATVAAVSMLLGVRAGWREIRAQRRAMAALTPRRRHAGEQRGGTTVIERAEVRAFCAGLLRPRVYVTTGALQALTPEQLQAVVAHEEHHRRRRDPLRLALLRIGADAFFFLPALRSTSERYAALAEVAADAAAVQRVGRGALAGAFVVFGSSGHPSALDGVDSERVDHLLGVRPRLGLRLRALNLSLVAGVALALAAASSAAAGSTLEVARLAADTGAAATTFAVPGAVMMALIWSRQRRAL